MLAQMGIVPVISQLGKRGSCKSSSVPGTRAGPAALGSGGAGKRCVDGVPCLGTQGEAGGTVPGLPSWQGDGK